MSGNLPENKRTEHRKLTPELKADGKTKAFTTEVTEDSETVSSEERKRKQGRKDYHRAEG